MADKDVSLDGLRKFLQENEKKIAQTKQKLEAIQRGFNSHYVRFKAAHDALLLKLTEKILVNRGAINPAFAAEVAAQLPQERQRLQTRRQELSQLTAQIQKVADDLLAQTQRQTEELRTFNSQFDVQEEQIKSQQTHLQAELEQLNAQVKQLSKGCLGTLFNLLKIGKLDQFRQRLVIQLQGLQKDLHVLRREWQTKRETFMREQTDLHTQWQTKCLELAQLRTEFNHLQNDQKLEKLATKRAIYLILDNLKDKNLCLKSSLETELQEMLTLNVETDSYTEGLRAISSLIALLGGLLTGMESFRTSVDALLKEQQKHNPHLPKLKISLATKVQTFHQQWSIIQKQVENNAQLCKAPLEFANKIQPYIAQTLNEQGAKEMFDSLGASLSRATQAWKG